MSPSDVLSFADIAVRDEAEVTIVELLNAIDNGRDCFTVRGISFRTPVGLVHTPRRPYVPLHSLIEDLSLLRGYRRKSTFSQLLHGTQTCALVAASRGCPFTCSFCYENMIGGTGFRRRDVEAVVEDVRRKRDFFGTRRFWLTDSNFSTNLSHAQAVLQALIDADLGCQFTVLARVEIGRRPEILDLMRQAGVVTVSVGMEAVDDAQLASIDKRQTVTDVRAAIHRIQDHGMGVFGLFMVGFDSDADDAPWRITEFCRREAVHGLSIYCLTEYPALPGRSLPRHRICETNLDYYSGHFATTFPKQVRPSVLERNTYDALLNFYSISRIAAGVRSRDWHSLRFAIPLYSQFRRMHAISQKHLAALEAREAGYYRAGRGLDVEKLMREPWLSAPLATDHHAEWRDAVEHERTSDDGKHNIPDILSSASHAAGVN